MLPAESGITYALGLLGERRTFDGGPERLPAGGILAGMFFSSPASKSPLERGDRLRWGVCSSLKTPFHKVLRPERRGCLSSRQRTSLPDSAGLEFLRNFRRHSARDSEDGGPLTANAVFISNQRVLALKRTAVLRIEMLK